MRFYHTYLTSNAPMTKETAIERCSERFGLFHNGFISYKETLIELSMNAHQEMLQDRSALIDNNDNMGGRAGLYDLLHEWTMEFEQKNKGREWDGEFFEEVDAFFKEKVKHIR